MKILRSSLMAFALFSLVSLWSCGGEDTPEALTFAERVEGTWRISEVRLDGVKDDAASASNYSITFTADAGFTVSPGTLSTDLKPNLNVADTGGSWTSSTTSITFTDGNSNSSVVRIQSSSPESDTEKLTEMTIAYTTDVSKTSTNVEIDFVKN